MSEKENPAERLYILLDKARAFNDEKNARVIADILNVPEEPSDVFFQAAIHFYKLFDDVIYRLRLVQDIDEEIFIEPIERLREAFPLTDLDGRFYISSIKEADMRSLKHAILEIRRQPLPPSIGQDILDKLQEDVSALYNLVDEAKEEDVPEALRKIILEGLWEINTAIRIHTARGVNLLHRALLVNVGTLVTNHPLFEQYEQTEAVSQYKGLVRRVWSIVPHAADVSGLIGAGYQVVKALLPDGR